MANACSTTTVFGDDKYFQQHELPGGAEAYDYTRCFIIYAQSTDTNYLNDLKIGIVSVLENGNDLGTPNTTPWRTKLYELLTVPPLRRHLSTARLPSTSISSGNPVSLSGSWEISGDSRLAIP